MPCIKTLQPSSESLAIEKIIKSSSKKESLKVLILGTSASGKSTVAKQMKILHTQGISLNEFKEYKAILILNVFIGMRELVSQAQQFNIKIAHKNKVYSNYFTGTDPFTQTLDSETLLKSKNLWEDKGRFFQMTKCW